MTNLKSKIINRNQSRKSIPAPDKKVATKKAPVKKTSKPVSKKVPAKKVPAKNIPAKKVPVKKVAPKKTATKKTARKVKEIKKIGIIDLAKLKGYRVEYFDDRFYKVILPANVHKSFIENIPSNYIEYTPEAVEVFLPSFTTIVSNAEPKPFLATWRGNIGNREADRISNEALDRGSNIHNAIEDLSNGAAIIYQNKKTMNITEKEIKEFKRKQKCQVHIIHAQDEMVQIARFQRLLSVLNPKILQTEQKVISLEHCYAGTLDQLWEIKGGTYQINSSRTATTLEAGNYIIDFKTGKGIDTKHCYTQLAAYFAAHPLKDKVVGGIAIHLNNDVKSGIEGVKLYPIMKKDLIPYFEHFLDLKKVYMFSNPVFPKKYDIPLILKLKK